MRNLMIFAIECMDELDSIGIPYGKVLDFSVNTRAKKRWGGNAKRFSVVLQSTSMFFFLTSRTM